MENSNNKTDILIIAAQFEVDAALIRGLLMEKHGLTAVEIRPAGNDFGVFVSFAELGRNQSGASPEFLARDRIQPLMNYSRGALDASQRIAGSGGVAIKWEGGGKW